MKVSKTKQSRVYRIDDYKIKYLLRKNLFTGSEVIFLNQAINEYIKNNFTPEVVERVNENAQRQMKIIESRKPDFYYLSEQNEQEYL